MCGRVPKLRVPFRTVQLMTAVALYVLERGHRGHSGGHVLVGVHVPGGQHEGYHGAVL